MNYSTLSTRNRIFYIQCSLGQLQVYKCLFIGLKIILILDSDLLQKSLCKLVKLEGVISIALVPSQISSFFLPVDAPKITQHPESQSVATGADTVFRVEAMGDDVQFQWQKDRIDIESNGSRLRCNRTRNASTLHIQHTKKNDKGHYRCIVRNPIEKSGKASYEARLSVCKF